MRLGPLLKTAVTWEKTPDVDHPYRAIVGKALWRIRLNDFPEKALYTLLVEDKEATYRSLLLSMLDRARAARC